jgi:hypothetical protein
MPQFNQKASWAVGVLALLVLAAGVEATAFEKVWTFDPDSPDALPSEFVIGTLVDGRPAGDWRVLRADQAKSPPHVLGQVQGKGFEHAYKVVLVNGTDGTDVDLEVSFFPVDGKADMGGGLIWRASDDRNYYLTRANPLEQNIRIYRVVKGIRHLLQNFNQTVSLKRWHTLRVTTTGCQIRVLYDERQVFDLCDHTFTRGRVGLWTKSDAVTYFDDLKVRVLK